MSLQQGTIVRNPEEIEETKTSRNDLRARRGRGHLGRAGRALPPPAWSGFIGVSLRGAIFATKPRVLRGGGNLLHSYSNTTVCINHETYLRAPLRGLGEPRGHLHDLYADHFGERGPESYPARGVLLGVVNLRMMGWCMKRNTPPAPPHMERSRDCVVKRAPCRWISAEEHRV